MYSVPSAQSDLPPLQQTGWGAPAWGAPEPPSSGPERDDRPATDRAPGTVYPSSGAPANPAPPAHQQPPAIPPPEAEEDNQVVSDAGPSPAADSYGKWARNQRSSAGTVYGGQRVTSVATASADGGSSPLENSGSLTGHILSQGTQEADEDDEDEPAKSSNLKVMIIIAIIVVALVAGGYLAVTFSKSFIDEMFSGVPTK
ncbi:hypothetical protein OHA72_07350 [Dactylosporangium sp. NBC_01737]|uniref:hypothetical protein n=1 Tax=Dactylosporangium sp. NBC_01737 TaxID=2975959 RepID=UPI002E135946|nr:hypothetical protein OHA72_07350 [Dactylosporangium sp. NBC_01737]